MTGQSFEFTGQVPSPVVGQVIEWGGIEVHHRQPSTGLDGGQRDRRGGLDNQGGAEDKHQVSLGRQGKTGFQGAFGQHFTEKSDVGLDHAVTGRAAGNLSRAHQRGDHLEGRLKATGPAGVEFWGTVEFDDSGRSRPLVKHIDILRDDARNQAPTLQFGANAVHDPRVEIPQSVDEIPRVVIVE